MTLKKHGFIYSNGHYLTEFKLIIDINKRESNIVNNDIIKNNIGEVVKPVDCNKLNSLQEQTEYRIMNIQNIVYRKKR